MARQRGWGARFLRQRNADGHWGRTYYQPKWISTHYTVLDLKNLGVSPEEPRIKDTLIEVLKNMKGGDGGIDISTSGRNSDVCVNGMFLNFASYFQMPGDKLESIVDFLLEEHMGDGGFNCESNQRGWRYSAKS